MEDALTYNKYKQIEKVTLRKFVAFYINNQKFAIEIDNVLEVLETIDITHIIHTPAYIEGVINLRGNIIAVINLREFFKLPVRENKQIQNVSEKIIIVKEEGKTAGLLVDEIDEIIECENVSFDSLPVTVTGKLSEYLQGIVNYRKEPIGIINLKNLILSEEIKRFDYE